MTDHEGLWPALIAAREELPVIVTTRTANAGSYSYKYADIADVVEVTTPVLARHGLAALTPIHAYRDDLAVTVQILHTSGEEKHFGPFPFPHGKDAQATGSACTYHRRYALIAALGMAVRNEDDDGARAQPRVADRVQTITPRQLAKARVLELSNDNPDQAKEAWKGIEGDGHEWGNDPVKEVEALWVEWINAKTEPA